MLSGSLHFYWLYGSFLYQDSGNYAKCSHYAKYSLGFTVIWLRRPPQQTSLLFCGAWSEMAFASHLHVLDGIQRISPGFPIHYMI